MGKRKLPKAFAQDDHKQAESNAPAKSRKLTPAVLQTYSSPLFDANDDVKRTMIDLMKDSASKSPEGARDLLHFSLTNKQNAGLLSHDLKPNTTFDRFMQLNQISDLEKSLYKKIVHEDTFAEGTHVGNFWEWSGADPVRNLKVAAPLFKLQSKDVKSELFTDIENLNDKAMKACCLNHVARDPNYIDHIDDQGLGRLRKAADNLAKQLNRDAPNDMDIQESVRLFEGRIDRGKNKSGDASETKGSSIGLPPDRTLSPARSPAPEKENQSIRDLEKEIDGFAFDAANEEDHAKVRSIMQALTSQRSKIISGQYDLNKLEKVIGTKENDITPEKAKRDDLASTVRDRRRSDRAG